MMLVCLTQSHDGSEAAYSSGTIAYRSARHLLFTVSESLPLEPSGGIDKHGGTGFVSAPKSGIDKHGGTGL